MRQKLILSIVAAVYLVPASVSAWPIPDTGQTTCYDEVGDVISCEGSGQDGEYTINPMSFTKLDANGNDLPDTAPQWAMVRDNVTGLIWEVKENCAAQNYDNPRCHQNTYTWYDPDPETNGGNPGTSGEWPDTYDFLAALNAGTGFGGFTDWRLPSREELRSIAAYETANRADLSIFPNTVLSNFWSSSTYAGTVLRDRAWYINFDHGYDGESFKAITNNVRAVRGGQAGSFEYLVINSGDTVTDVNTGLMWRRTTEGPMTWTAALNHCGNMTTDGYTDWRLPTLKELASITDLNRYDPSAYQPYFFDTVSSDYWSSSTHAYHPDQAWGVFFDNGQDSGCLKSDDWYVRAVRGGQVWLLDHLIITDPAQASRWTIGCPMDIRWDTQDMSGNVNILLSRDGGRNFAEMLAESTPNDGEFQWIVTGPATVNTYLKIEPLSDPAKSTAVGLFSIHEPDASFPEILSITPDGPALTKAADASFSAAFSEAVYGVTENHFGVTTTGDTNANITSVSGSGDAYTIQVGGISGSGTVRVDFTADCLVKDNDALPVLSDLAGTAITIDQTPPQVQFITISGPAQTSASVVQFAVDFGELVNGVEGSDFRITRTGSLTGGTVTQLAVSSDEYIITVTGYAGLGNLGLDLLDNDSITDAAGNPLGGPGLVNGDFTAGQTYEIGQVPGIWVSPSHLDISEPDGAADFVLTLSRRPSAPVVIPLYSANQNECILTHIDGTPVSADPTVVLDGDSWDTGVPVTVTAKADFRADGDSDTRIVILPATSADPDFHLMDAPDVTVTVRDVYDGIAITEVYPASGDLNTPMVVTVDGTGFGTNPTVRLQNISKTVQITSRAVNPAGTRITMTVPAIDVEGIYDLVVCNGVGCETYAGAITILAMEASEIKISPLHLDISEPNVAADFVLTLSRRPSAPVYIPLYSANQNECTLTRIDGNPVTGNPMVVLSENSWNTGVPVTVTAKADFRPDGDSDTRIVILPATSADPDFHLKDAPDVTVTVRDVYNGLAITEVYPASGDLNTLLAVTVDGLGFGPNPTVRLQNISKTVQITSRSVNSAGTRITMTVPEINVQGTYNLVVCNGIDCETDAGAITILDPEAAERMKHKKAIIVAGSGPTADSLLWPATQKCADLAYKALIDQGFTHDNILYLSAGMVEGHIDAVATRDLLEDGLLLWAKGDPIPGRPDIAPGLPAEELVVYMTGHGNPSSFEINNLTSPVQRIRAQEDLAVWFHRLQYEAPAMPGKLIFVYDACHASSFLAPLAMAPSDDTRERYVAASVPDGYSAWFMDEGAFSFSAYFWDHVSRNGHLYSAFVNARNLMKLGQNQQPLMDINGDGLPDAIDLNILGDPVLIGLGRPGASSMPSAGSVMSDKAIDCKTSETVWVTGLNDTYTIEEAWGIRVSDEDDPIDPDEPVLNKGRITLTDPNGDDKYTGVVAGLTRNEVYRFNFYFRDSSGTVGAVNGQAAITRQCGASMADVVYVLKTAAGVRQPAPAPEAFERMDGDGNDRLGLEDAVHLLRLVAEM